MGNNLFGANISGKLNRSLGRKLPKGTLRKEVQGTRDPDNLAAGRSGTSTDHQFRGIQMGLSALRKNSIVPDARDAFLILGDSIKPSVEPVQGDKILFGPIVNTIVNVSHDPDKATFTCQTK